jgi:phosphoribosyl 1,2-cyclic phosphodiesterase
MNHQIIFWGVKGSCPGGAPTQYGYSVNTSCIEISNDEELIILDAGSGLVFLGQSDRDFRRYKRISLFISHYHYDHLIGLPFFMPAYQSSLEFHVYGPVTEISDPERAIKGLFSPPYLPMGFEALQAKFHFHSLMTNDLVSTLGAQVKTMASDHPGGNLVYRIALGGKSFSYITDLGHNYEIHESLVKFCKGSDWIYYDANFTQSEYFHSKYEGWGHSTHSKGVALLDEAAGDKLFLGHHALHRRDKELDEIQSQFDPERITLVKDGSIIEWEDAL